MGRMPRRLQVTSRASGGGHVLQGTCPRNPRPGARRLYLPADCQASTRATATKPNQRHGGSTVGAGCGPSGWSPHFGRLPWIDTTSLAAMTPTRRGLAGPGCTRRRSTSSRSPTRRRPHRVCHRQRAGGAVSDRLLSDVVFRGVGAPGGELYARPAAAVLSADGSATRRCVGPQWKGPALTLSSHCNFERRFDVACSIRFWYDVY